MQKLRLLPLAILSLSIGLMTACDSTSSNNAPTISSQIIAKDAAGNTIDVGTTLTTSTTGHLTGTVTDVASWIWVVKNTSGTPVDTLVPSHSPAGSGDTKLGGGSDVLISFTPTAKWGPNGAYTVIGTLTGTSGGTTTTPAITFQAIPGGSSGTALTSQGTLMVGGQTVSNLPSFIGLTPVQAYTGTQSKTSYASIDLIVTSDAAIPTNSDLESTAAGVSDNSLGSTYWGNGRATLIQDVGATAPTTLEAAKALLTSTNQSATIVSGHVYVAKTVEGIYAVLTASAVSGSGNNIALSVTVLE